MSTQKPIWIAWMAALISALASPAAMAGIDSGGGDPAFIRWDRTQGYLIDSENGLKADVKLVLKNLKVEDIHAPEVRELFHDFLVQDVMADVAESTYAIRSSCTDFHGNEKPATAGMNERKGAVCFNLATLVALNTSHAELVALAIHEHAHHFGYLDEDHRMARAVLEQFSDSRLESLKKGEPQLTYYYATVSFDVRNTALHRMSYIKKNDNDVLPPEGLDAINGFVDANLGWITAGKSFRLDWRAPNVYCKGSLKGTVSVWKDNKRQTKIRDIPLTPFVGCNDGYHITQADTLIVN